MRKETRFLRALCVMVMSVLLSVLSMAFFVFPASALNVNALKAQIESHNGGGLVATVNGNVITVTGSNRSNANTPLQLYIDNNITIRWQAEISANIPYQNSHGQTLEIDHDFHGNGDRNVWFEVLPGAFIENTASDGIALDIDDPVKLSLSGGVLKGYEALDIGEYHSPIYSDGNATIMFFANRYYPSPINDLFNYIALHYPSAMGIVFAGTDGRVYGNVALAPGQTLEIPVGYTLTIPGGASLNNKGRIINNGTIVGNVTGNSVEGKGSSNSGGGASSGGGCDAGMGIAGLLALAAGSMRARKKRS